MLRHILDLPVLVILLGISALAMFLPAAHAVVMRDHEIGRAFFYSGTILLVLSGMIGLATANHRPRNAARSHLMALAMAYLVLPLALALPFDQAIPDTSYVNAWFEMLSSFTTTGASLYDQPERLAPSLHLWRALVGWLGGFFILVMAMAVLAPLNLGGLEVVTGRTPGRGDLQSGIVTRVADPSERLTRFTVILLPAYAGLTAALWVLLLMLGDDGMGALCRAMGTLSTSGIVCDSGRAGGQAGVAGEAAMAAFFVFALSRRTLPGSFVTGRHEPLLRDPELRLAGVIVAVVVITLFLRHWLAAFQLADGTDLPGVGSAVWGSAFTALSYLTTTGYVSQEWSDVRLWSGLQSPGLILLGLAIVGGGVATTAGGVKLFRVYALFRHGERELEKLVHPNSVGGSGQSARRLRREGAYLAWIFFMLFAMSIAVGVGALALAGIDFENGLILTLAALTTTGQLAQTAGASPISYAGLSDAAKLILAGAMVLGRVEMLALLALVVPSGWRN